MNLLKRKSKVDTTSDLCYQGWLFCPCSIYWTQQRLANDRDLYLVFTSLMNETKNNGGHGEGPRVCDEDF